MGCLPWSSLEPSSSCGWTYCHSNPSNYQRGRSCCRLASSWDCWLPSACQEVAQRYLLVEDQTDRESSPADQLLPSAPEKAVQGRQGRKKCHRCRTEEGSGRASSRCPMVALLSLYWWQETQATTLPSAFPASLPTQVGRHLLPPPRVELLACHQQVEEEQSLGCLHRRWDPDTEQPKPKPRS